MKTIQLYALITLLVWAATSRAAVPDTAAVKIWVFFTDKPQFSATAISQRAVTRRARAGMPRSTREDAPVNQMYVRGVEQAGGRLQVVYKWEDAATFMVPRSALRRVSSLPYVKKLQPVARYITTIPHKSLAKKMTIDSAGYGLSWTDLALVNVPAAQDYLGKVFPDVPPGQDVLVAMFDAGFYLKHDCMAYALAHNSIVAAYDFVDHDTTVYDPDSVRNNPASPYYDNDTHGSQTLALVGGYDPGYFMGVAWGARFVLARTENSGLLPDGQETETRTEEDNWAAAVVWAESLGVDIISSSLGYRSGFTDSLDDYPYSAMDGKTTIVSRAASHADSLGMVVVNAMGNDGANSSGTLDAPADVENVVSVGAVSSDKAIAGFSGTGPTSDGRIKPDLVAQGESVIIPDMNQLGHQYTSGDGTSFSTPVVAGICALIKQRYPNDNNEQIRTKLYFSCKYTPFQDSVDNVYGRGIPDALVACLDSLGTRSVYQVQDFSVLPTVVRKDNSSITAIIPEAGSGGGPVTAAVRSVDGSVVWKYSASAPAAQQVVIPWNCRVGNRRVAPGIYFFYVKYNDARYVKKFLVTG